MKKMSMKNFFALVMALCLMVALGAAAWADTSVSCTVGQQIDNVAVYEGQYNIVTCQYVGDKPDGIELKYIDNKIYIHGAATTAGTYSFQLNMDTEGGADSSSVTITVGNAVATPVPTASPGIVNSKPVITKHPTGETVEAGGSAAFVSRADGADSFVWRIVSPDTSNTYKASEASWYFKGLSVSGADTERLQLSNIPTSMNGWAVECMYKNSLGYSFSNGAIIKVTGATGSTNDPSAVTATPKPNADTLKAPTVDSSALKSVELVSGEKTRLSVSATNPTPGIGTLTYQWYSADSNDINKISAIDGANSNSYTPPESDTSKYYCVGVWVSKEGQKSSTTYSPLVQVSYKAADAAGNAQGGNGPDDVQLGNGSMDPAPSVTPVPTPVPDVETDGGSFDRDASSTLIFYIVIAGLALLAVGGILIYLIIANARNKDEDEY